MYRLRCTRAHESALVLQGKAGVKRLPCRR